MVGFLGWFVSSELGPQPAVTTLSAISLTQSTLAAVAITQDSTVTSVSVVTDE